MAGYIETGEIVGTSKIFQRGGAYPLDRSSMFSSYADAVKYANGSARNKDSRSLYKTAYIGQIITVYENDTVKHYQIEPDKTLKEVGSNPNIDCGEY